MADPSAPSLVSPVGEANLHDSRPNLQLPPPSPVFMDNPYPTSPSSSTGFNHSTSSRSVSDIQSSYSSKVAVHDSSTSPFSQPPLPQQQQQQPQPQFSTPKQQPKVSTPKPQPMPKPSIVIQQCNIYTQTLYSIGTDIYLK